MKDQVDAPEDLEDLLSLDLVQHDVLQTSVEGEVLRLLVPLV